MLPADQSPQCILLANEPLAYRQVLVGAFRTARPHLQVLEVAPDELDAAVQEHAPLLVICDQVTQLVERCVSAWVVLYPGGARRVTSSLAGTQESTADLDLAALLAFVDRAGASSSFPAPGSGSTSW